MSFAVSTQVPCCHVEGGDTYMSNADVAKAGFHLNKTACDKDKVSLPLQDRLYLKSV